MNNLINLLWNGSLKPSKNLCENDRRIKELEGLIERNKEKLIAELKDEEQKRFEIYNECIDEYISLVCEQVFSKGFSCGAKLLTEAYSEADGLME